MLAENIKEKLEKVLPLVQKPAKYTGGELGCVYKDLKNVDVHFAFCFPDTYDIGMSHLGMKILYAVINDRENFYCERVFAPWTDMEEQMRKENLPLFSLETKTDIADFDIVGFTLQYELSYTNVLNMLNLAGIPLLAKDRDDLSPLIVAGGPCACNPEPLSDFIDLFMPGEGEEVILELCEEYEKAKKAGLTKKEFLINVSKIQGIYVPSLYDVSYKIDGTIEAIIPTNGAPYPVKKRVIADFDKVFYPETFVVPFTETVHDRAVLEVLRGCIRGCRFCQAGFIYRPFREKNADTLNKQGKSLCDSTGYDEISLSSLSTSDYSNLQDLLGDMLSWTKPQKINMSLPSLRIDNFPSELVEQIQEVRKSSLTFAPEAGTQRLRDAINKNITEEDIMKTARTAFEGGYTSIKLYFMIGLPTETMEDIKGIAETAQKVVDLYFSIPNRNRKKSLNVSITVSSFVPKAFTPFEFDAQNTKAELEEKQKYLLSQIESKKISVSCHGSNTSFLEGVFARGDRRLGKVLLKAYEKGCKLDSWSECFDFRKWMESFEETGVSTEFFANRKREYNEILPWEHMDYGVSKEFLIKENKKAYESVTTAHCRQNCAACGANKLIGGKCFD